MSALERLELANKVALTTKDIAKFLGVCDTTARKIKQEIISQHEGKSLMPHSKALYTNAFLEYIGVTITDLEKKARIEKSLNS